MANGGLSKGNPSIDNLVSIARIDPTRLTDDEYQSLCGVHLYYFYPADLGTWAANENALWACIAPQFGFATPNPPAPDTWFNQGLSLAEVLA